MPTATLSDPDQWIAHVRYDFLSVQTISYQLQSSIRSHPSLCRARSKADRQTDKTPKIRQCKHLPERQMKLLCTRVRDLLLEESNVHPVQSPVTVCGDIHGQFWDVLEIFRQGGEAPETSYIFMVCFFSYIRLLGFVIPISRCVFVLYTGLRALY